MSVTFLYTLPELVLTDSQLHTSKRQARALPASLWGCYSTQGHNEVSWAGVDQRVPDCDASRAGSFQSTDFWIFTNENELKY